MKSVDSLY